MSVCFQLIERVAVLCLGEYPSARRNLNLCSYTHMSIRYILHPLRPPDTNCWPVCGPVYGHVHTRVNSVWGMATETFADTLPLMWWSRYALVTLHFNWLLTAIIYALVTLAFLGLKARPVYKHVCKHVSRHVHKHMCKHVRRHVNRPSMSVESEWTCILSSNHSCTMLRHP